MAEVLCLRHNHFDLAEDHSRHILIGITTTAHLQSVRKSATTSYQEDLNLTYPLPHLWKRVHRLTFFCSRLFTAQDS